MNRKGLGDKSVGADFDREWQRAMNALPAEWAAKKLQQMRNTRMKSYGPGTKLILGYLGLDDWDGQVVTVVRHEKGSLVCQLEAKPGLWMRVPYYEYGSSVLGPPTAENLERAQDNIRGHKLMQPAMERLNRSPYESPRPLRVARGSSRVRSC